MPLVERRYAEALIDIAARDGELEEYQQELQAVADLYGSYPEFRLFLLNPEVDTEYKKKAIGSALEGRAKREIVNFLMLLIDKGRIKHLPGILDEYIRIADSRRNILSMTIISAAPLTESQVDSIKERYKKLYNSHAVKAAIMIDESIIGGVKVKIGDKIIDGSIQGRLEGLKEMLLK